MNPKKLMPQWSEMQGFHESSSAMKVASCVKELVFEPIALVFIEPRMMDIEDKQKE